MSHYGSSLSGFMREVIAARHVLLVVDENYVDRADHKAKSGVGIETAWISGVYSERPTSWLAALWVRNPERSLPSWMTDLDPKSFDFNAQPAANDFPGAIQLNEIWRWIEGLPASTANAVPLSELRRRSSRLERIELLRDPNQYASPHLHGRATFRHGDHQHYTIGHDEYEFKVNFSGGGRNLIYVYRDSGLKAVGLVTAENYDPATVEKFLRPGRIVRPRTGQSVILLNQAGALCKLTIDEVQEEINAAHYVPAHVTFSWKVLVP